LDLGDNGLVITRDHKTEKSPLEVYY